MEIIQQDEVEFLANEYIQTAVIPVDEKLDALHIAASTVSKMDFLVRLEL